MASATTEYCKNKIKLLIPVKKKSAEQAYKKYSGRIKMVFWVFGVNVRFGYTALKMWFKNISVCLNVRNQSSSVKITQPFVAKLTLIVISINICVQEDSLGKFENQPLVLANKPKKQFLFYLVLASFFKKRNNSDALWKHCILSSYFYLNHKVYTYCILLF